MLTPNTPAPDFSLAADDERIITLSDLCGTPVVLYFYPKDDTSGCTTEACEFRESFPRFTAAGAVVLGISPDPVKSHVAFKEKYGLPFTLLADVGHHVAEVYGVWKEKSMYGRKYMGVERTTFVIDRSGIIVRIFHKVKPAGHAAEVAQAIAEL